MQKIKKLRKLSCSLTSHTERIQALQRVLEVQFKGETE